MMKKLITTLICGSVLVNSHLLMAADKKDNPVVFKSKNHKLTKKDIAAAYVSSQEFAGLIPFKTAYYVLLNQLGYNLALKDEAIAQGFDKDPKVMREIEEAKASILVKHFSKRQMEKAVTESKLKALYNEYKESFKKSLSPNEKEINLSHIVVKTEEEASKVIAELENKSFDKVAKERSVAKETKLGWFRRAGLRNEMGDAAFDLSGAGKYSQTPLKLPSGLFMILKCNGFRAARPQPFEKMLNRLNAEATNAFHKDLDAQMKKKYDMVFYDETGKKEVDPIKKMKEEEFAQAFLSALVRQQKGIKK